MKYPGEWPYIFHVVRLSATALVAAALAFHAFVCVKSRENRLSGPLKWAYAIYLLMFLGVIAANIISVIVSINRKAYEGFDYFHIGLFSLLVITSYVPLLVGVKKPRL